MLPVSAYEELCRPTLIDATMTAFSTSLDPRDGETLLVYPTETPYWYEYGDLD
jgi:hypothetical protein